MRLDALKRHAAKHGCTVDVRQGEGWYEVLVTAEDGGWDGVHQLVTNVESFEATPAEARRAASDDLKEYATPGPCDPDCGCRE